MRKLTTLGTEGSCLESLIYASIILIQMNEVEHSKTALKRAIQQSKGKDTFTNSSQSRNVKNNIAYMIYLSLLIPKIPKKKLPPKAQILHLGESHCLAFANQKIYIRSNELLVRPSLIRGAKAFHLSDKSKKTSQKAAFEKRAQQDLHSYKYIFLSFGEIDCRADEGILKHCHKTGKSIKEVSEMTAKNYSKWTTTRLADYTDKLIYFGTPAPLQINSKRNTSSEDAMRLLAIITFNNSIMEHCRESGIPFADVYKLTADKDGYNNKTWMLDGVHLKPEALNEPLKMLVLK